MKAFILAAAVAAVVQAAAPEMTLAASEQWSGSVIGASASVYDAPGGTQVGSLDAGTHVSVSNWVYGPQRTTDNYTWADIGGGRFVHSSVLRHSPLPDGPPAPPQFVSTGHWADANLTQQILTLYDGSVPVRMSLMNSGRPGPDTESHPGIWPILRRVANETMIGPGYAVGGVLYTQYFTNDAEAVHLNYWLADDERGMPRSHGCLGLPYDAAAFAWQFLDIGSPVYVHA